MRDVARRVASPVATVGDYFSARHLPGLRQLPMFRSILEACGVSDPDQIEAWVRAVERVRASTDGRGAPPTSPYRGLEPFREADAPFFFGRGRAVEAVLDVLRRQLNDTSGASSASAPSGAVPTAILATQATYPDAVSASPLAASAHLPLLLTNGTTLSSQTSSALQTLGIKQVILMGGPVAVSDAVVQQIKALGITVLRGAGIDATDTAVQLASLETATGTSGLGWPTAGGGTTLALARGDFYADALSASVVTGTKQEPVLLTEDPNTLGSYLTGYLTQEAGKIAALQPFGGPVALTDTGLQAAVTATGS